MNRFAIPLSIIAAAAAAACSQPAYRSDPQMVPIVPQVVSYRAGTGVVDNVLLTPGPISGASGGSASSAGRLNRLAIRMDSGRDIQYIDTDANEFRKGDRVELTPDRMIRRVP